MTFLLEALHRESFDALFLGHPDATYAFDAEGNFIRGNDQLVELTGYSHDELGTMTFDDVVHPDERHVVVTEFVAAVSGETRRYQSRGVKKSGEQFVMDVTNIPVRDKSGAVVAVIGIARDLSDIEKVEQARLRMEGQLKSTLNQMAIGIGFIDRQWRFTFVNAKARKYLRKHQGTFDATLWEIYPGIEKTEFGSVYRRAMDQGEVATTRAFSDVFKRWFEVTAFPTAEGIAIHIADVTEDQQTKLQLEENAKRLSAQAALLDAARDAIHLRELDGRITYWNKGAEQLFGWTRDETIGVQGHELLPVKPEEFDRATGQVMRAGHWAGELEKYTRDGRVITVECRWQLIRDDDGRPTSIFAVDSDITEWKRGEEKRNRAQRLESLGTLAGGIAHDLNNVLTPILMSAQLLSANETDADRLALFGSIESGVKRGADMVRQVLSFARGEEGQRSTVDVAALFAQVRDFCKDTLPKSVQFQIDVAEQLWPITADHTQLFQVLVNLVTNARDSMPEGGNITIRARNLDGDTPSIIMEIEDSGSGMDSETIARAFEPFFTTKETGSGTGLGLSTSMTIIRSHDGELDVYSEPGQGTRFRIRLPATVDDTVQMSEQPVLTNTLPRGNNEVILVVDDEATIREIACQTLEANGYRTLAAANGLEAVEIMERGEVTVDLVLTDMMMPEMDGAATAAYFLANHPHVAVIAASGLNANGGVARAAHSGVTRFLSKPFTTTELLTSVRDTLDTWGDR